MRSSNRILLYTIEQKKNDVIAFIFDFLSFSFFSILYIYIYQIKYKIYIYFKNHSLIIDRDRYIFLYFLIYICRYSKCHFIYKYCVVGFVFVQGSNYIITYHKQ